MTEEGRKEGYRGRERNLWLLFLAGCLLLEAFFVVRAFLGFNTADEMYIIGTSERVYRGEKILIDEWNPTQQLCTFLVHPLYCLLRGILGSTEGIVLAFRMVSLLFWLAMGILIYRRIRRKGAGAVAAAWLFLIFMPFGIYTLSYNSIEMSVLPLLLACLYEKERGGRAVYVVYGVMAAVIVLANPFALFFYAGYGLLCLGASLWAGRTGRPLPQALRFGNYLWMCLGAAILAAVFAAFVLGRGSLAEIRANLPFILGDSEHDQGLRAYLNKTSRYFYLCFKNYKYMFLGFGVLYPLSLLDRGRFSRAGLYLGLGLLCTAPYLIYYGFIFQHITVNYQMLPLTFLGLEAYILTKQRDRRLFCCWFLPALLFTLAVQYATNTGIVTISAAYGMDSVAAVMLLWDCLEEIRAEGGASWKRTAVTGVAALALVLQFAGSFWLRMTYAWGDEKTWLLDTRMERGPLKGVYTTRERAEDYAAVLDELDGLDLTTDDQLLVVGVAPWIYLYADAGCGSYSTWQVHDGSTQLTPYYALHPDKFPTVIYMMHWGEDFLNCELSQPFKERGYEMFYLGQRIVMEAPERQGFVP